ncbi:hypothetical protein HDU98_011559 [Podochytrium sp. JEL0797]|nr:hypothetical protein HDU98_011559 [Podochytrium sp. JEL0797]
MTLDQPSDSPHFHSSPPSVKIDTLLVSMNVSEFVANHYASLDSVSSELDGIAISQGPVQDPNATETGSSYDAGSSWPMHDANESQPSLHDLQLSGSTISGFLCKLDVSQDSTSPSCWNERYFVLSETGTLYLFRSSIDEQAQPLAHLPLATCFAFIDPEHDSPILRVQARESPRSSLKRTWTLKAPNEDTLSLWARSINRIIAPDATSSIRRPRSSSVASPRLSSASTANGSITNDGYLSSPVSDDFTILVRRPSAVAGTGSTILMRRNDSISSNGINIEEREALMRAKHQEYLVAQKSIQRDLVAKKEIALRAQLEEKARVEAQKQAAIDLENQKKLDAAKKKRMDEKQDRVNMMMVSANWKFVNI